MSIQYKLFEFMVRLVNVKKICRIKPNELEMYYEKNLSNQSSESPKYMFKKYNVTALDFQGRKCYKVESKREKSDKAIILIHGGAYILEIGSFSWRVVSKLIDALNITVYVPIYPLCPKHNYIETYNMMTKVYDYVLQNNNPSSISIMGDSAGAQIALSFCQYIKTLDYPQPHNIILLSPSIEMYPSVEVIEKMKGLEKSDCMLSSEMFNYIGDYWARGTCNEDYLVSPIYGDFYGLGKLSVFMGTNEIFYAHIDMLLEKAREANARIDYYEGKGMMHTWPVLPCGREGRVALEKIIDIIKS